MDGLQWKTLLKWMIWGYHYFWKHPYKSDHHFRTLQPPHFCSSRLLLRVGFFPEKRSARISQSFTAAKEMVRFLSSKMIHGLFEMMCLDAGIL